MLCNSAIFKGEKSRKKNVGHAACCFHGKDTFGIFHCPYTCFHNRWIFETYTYFFELKLLYTITISEAQSNTHAYPGIIWEGKIRVKESFLDKAIQWIKEDNKYLLLGIIFLLCVSVSGIYYGKHTLKICRSIVY